MHDLCSYQLKELELKEELDLLFEDAKREGHSYKLLKRVADLYVIESMRVDKALLHLNALQLALESFKEEESFVPVTPGASLASCCSKKKLFVH